MDKQYKGYRIQKTYCVVNSDGSAEDYFFTPEEAKECIDKLIKQALKQNSAGDKNEN
jgi:hypothetical protein